MSKSKIEHAKELFYEAILSYNPRELTKSMYQLLQMPVVIMDDMGVVVSIWPEESVGDPDYESFLSSGIVSNENYAWYLNKIAGVNANPFEPILIDRSAQGQAKRLVASVYANWMQIGSIGVLTGNAPITEELLEIVRLFAKSAGQILLYLKDREFLKEQRDNHILHYLLNAANADSDDYKNNATRLSVRYTGPYVVMYVKCAKEAYEDVYTPALFNTIRRYVPNVLQTDLDEGFYFLLGNCSEEILTSLLKELKIALRQYPVHISTCRMFANLTQVQGFYMQAKLTMQTGERISPHLFYFRAEEYLPLQIADFFAQHNDITPYVSSTMKRIIEYDKEHGTEYYLTLWAYLYSFMNVKDTTEMLHIHFNTIYYRIERLKDLFGIDFQDYYVLNNLKSNFELLYVTEGFGGKDMADHYQQFHSENNSL